MTTVKDTVESSIASGSDGVELTREYILQGLTGNAEAKLFNALTHSTIPKHAEFHPVIPFIRVASIIADPIDSDTVKVSVTYRQLRGEEIPPDDTGAESVGLIQIGSATQSTVTEQDKDGNQLFVSIKIPATDDDGTTKEEEEKQTGEVSIEVPTTVLRQTRKETAPPTVKSTKFTGTVNRTSVWGYPPRTLLCLRLEGIASIPAEGNIVGYEVSYEFQYKPDNWDATLLYIDDDTDKPHKDVDIDSGNGVATVRVYKEEEFRGLNLKF